MGKALSVLASIATILSLILAFYIFWNDTDKKDEPKEREIINPKPAYPKPEKEKTVTPQSDEEKPVAFQPVKEKPKKEAPITSILKNTELEKPIPKKSKPASPNYLSNNEPYDIAILSKSKKSNIENQFKSHFKSLIVLVSHCVYFR